MVRNLKAAALGAATALALATSAGAAPITYFAFDATGTISNNSDSFTNVTISGVDQDNTPSLQVDVGSPDILPALLFDPRANNFGPQNDRGDSIGDNFNILASIVLRVGSISYTFVAQGLMTGWTVTNGGTYNGGTLSWISQPTIPAGSPLAVVFDNTLTRQTQSSNLVTTLRVSVVPLPAGALLLLTGLLGLVGLSRRRKAIA